MEVNCPFCLSLIVINKMSSENETTHINCTLCSSSFPIDNDVLSNTLEADNKQKELNSNFEKAMTYIPHTFIPSKMLYLTAKINNHEIKFLIDTGAQMSILPLSVAIACNLQNVIDDKYNGELKGVGSDKIMGRIHYVELELAYGFYSCGFTICKNDDLVPLIGIDIIRNLGFNINFSKNVISFNNGLHELPFE